MSQVNGTFAVLVEDLPRQQKRLMKILQRGGHYSVADISIMTGQSDPRTHIRHLRNKNFPSNVISYLKIISGNER